MELLYPLAKSKCQVITLSASAIRDKRMQNLQSSHIFELAVQFLVCFGMYYAVELPKSRWKRTRLFDCFETSEDGFARVCQLQSDFKKNAEPPDQRFTLPSK